MPVMDDETTASLMRALSVLAGAKVMRVKRETKVNGENTVRLVSPNGYVSMSPEMLPENTVVVLIQASSG